GRKLKAEQRLRQLRARPQRHSGRARAELIYSPGRSESMDQARPNLPKEAIQLYNLFIHGQISRRAFMEGVQRFAIGGLTAATIVEALMPNYRSEERRVGKECR